MSKSLEPGKVLAVNGEYDSIEVHDYGRYPETLVRTIAPGSGPV